MNEKNIDSVKPRRIGAVRDRALIPERLKVFISLEGDFFCVEMVRDYKELTDAIAYSFSTNTAFVVELGDDTMRHLNPRYIKEVRVSRM